MFRMIVRSLVCRLIPAVLEREARPEIARCCRFCCFENLVVAARCVWLWLRLSVGRYRVQVTIVGAGLVYALVDVAAIFSNAAALLEVRTTS